MCFILFFFQYWRRPFKNIGGNQNIGEQKVSLTKELIGVSQLLGAHVRAVPPRSLRLCLGMVENAHRAIIMTEHCLELAIEHNIKDLAQGPC